MIITTALLSLFASAPASAQAVNDAIGQIIAGNGMNWSKKCFDGTWTPKPDHIAKGPGRVDGVMATYRAIAAAGGDLRQVIGSEGMREWSLDGAAQPLSAVRDPFVARTARLERVFVRSSNQSRYYHVQWRALAADGSEIGIYDGLMWGLSPKFMKVSLYTLGSAVRPPTDVPFCMETGDVEAWRQATAEREARRAEKRAARQKN